jgi:hypothetical protein
MCGDLAFIVEAKDVGAIDFELLSRGWRAHKRTSVSPRCRDVKHNTVIVGDRELDLKMEIGERLDKAA